MPSNGYKHIKKFLWHYAEHVVTIFGQKSEQNNFISGECIIRKKVKVQNAGLAQLCFQHASNRIHFFQNVLTKHVRKVQEERSRSPDCSHRQRRGLPGEEHQVCSDDNDDDDNDNVSGTMRRTSESGSGSNCLVYS